jgi:hypothetical protein
MPLPPLSTQFDDGVACWRVDGVTASPSACARVDCDVTLVFSILRSSLNTSKFDRSIGF